LIKQFCANAGALVDGLITESNKDLATLSLNTVRSLADQLKRKVDALRGDELPDLSPSERRQKKECLRLEEPLQWTAAPR